MILLMMLLGFDQPEIKHCVVIDCSPEACVADGECLIGTPEGEVCHPKCRTYEDGRARYWRTGDDITCPTTDIEPT